MEQFLCQQTFVPHFEAFVRRIKKSALGGFGNNQLRPVDTTRKSKLS